MLLIGFLRSSEPWKQTSLTQFSPMKTAARKHLESNCAGLTELCALIAAKPRRIKLLKGKSHRPGLRQCNACRQHLSLSPSARIFEDSHIHAAQMAVAPFSLMAASKKGISAHQLHRMLGDYLQSRPGSWPTESGKP